MEADYSLVSFLQVAAEPLDLIGVYVGGEKLYRCWQIQDDGVCLSWLPSLHHRFADFEGVFYLRVGEAFGRILELYFGSFQLRQQVPDELNAVHRDLLDLFLRHAEGHSSLQRRSRVVDVHDGFLRSLQALEGSANKVFAGLGQRLQGNAFGYTVLLDQLSGKVEFCLCGGGKPDLDFLESDFQQKLEKFQFLLHSHGNGESLVAVAQVHAAPNGNAINDAVGPRAVGQIYRSPWAIFAYRRILHCENILRISQKSLNEKRKAGMEIGIAAGRSILQNPRAK